MRWLAIFSLILVFSMPAFVLGFHEPGHNFLVPCNGPDCTPCHVAQLAQGVLNFLIQVGVILAGIMIAWAGLQMAMAAGDTGKVSAARGVFTNVVIGLIITLAAWLIIDTVMKVFVNGAIGPWNEIQCTPIDDFDDSI